MVGVVFTKHNGSENEQEDRINYNDIAGADNGRDSGLTKHKGSENEQEDRISELPNSILLRILSFLPTKDKTLVIPRFGNLWSFIHNLDFDLLLYGDYSSHDKRFVNFVSNVLIRYDVSTIYKFRLRFKLRICYPGSDWDPEDRPTMGTLEMFYSEINAWIGYALKRQVKVLDLDFFPHYNLPSFVLTGGSVIELKVAGCSISLPEKIDLRSLQSLSLTRTTLREDAVEKILSGCPLLESLSLNRCSVLSQLSISSQRLKKFMIVHSCSRTEISCPYMTSLHMAGWLDRMAIKNLSSLVDATVEYENDWFSSREGLRLWMILQKFHHVKVLTICDWLILVLGRWELKRLPCQSCNWKCLVLKTKLTKRHFPGIVSLLRNSPTLEMLTIYVHPKRSHFWAADDAWCQSDDADSALYPFYKDDDDAMLFPYNWTDREYYRLFAKPSLHCLMTRLKTVSMYGYVTGWWVIQLVQYLLQRATVLEKMTISTKRNVHPDHQNHFTSEKMQEFSEKLSNFPSASAHAETLISWRNAVSQVRA